jgi:hypothetical protein
MTSTALRDTAGAAAVIELILISAAADARATNAVVLALLICRPPLGVARVVQRSRS